MPEIAKTCGNCGFFSKVRQGTWSQTEFEPVDPPERQSGNIYVSGNRVLVAYPLCIMGKHSLLNLNDIANAIIDREKDDPNFRYKDAILELLGYSRDNCPSWFEWDENLTPRQHYEEYRMLELEKLRKESEKRTEIAQSRAESAQTRDFRISMFALVLASVIGVVQIWVGWQQVETQKATTVVVLTATPQPQPSTLGTPSSPKPAASVVSP